MLCSYNNLQGIVRLGRWNYSDWEKGDKDARQRFVFSYN